MFTKKTL